MVNTQLLRRAVEWVEHQDTLPEESREWNQSEWVRPNVCGTTYCVAGWVVLQCGWKFNDPESTVDVTKGDEIELVGFVAQDELGLTHEQAEALFSGTNSAEDVRTIAESFVGGRL